jgi:hypothetical protein
MPIESLNRRRWGTIIELSSAKADHIENFSNPHRRDATLNYLAPAEFENLNCVEIQTSRINEVHQMGHRSLRGGDGIRTHCLYIANVALYQLSYTPEEVPSLAERPLR